MGWVTEKKKKNREQKLRAEFQERQGIKFVESEAVVEKNCRERPIYKAKDRRYKYQKREHKLQKTEELTHQTVHRQRPAVANTRTERSVGGGKN